jgi:hypothetical protein
VSERPLFKGIGPALLEGIENAPSQAWQRTKQQAGQAWNELNPFSPEREQARQEGMSGQLSNWLRTGRGLAHAAGLPFTPFVEAAKSAFGPAYGEAVHGVGTLIAPETAAKDQPETLHQMGESAIETASAAAAPRRFAPIGLREPVPLPPAPEPSGPMGVTLSEGQATRELPALQAEQAARSGQLGDRAQARAQAFQQQQREQVAAATENAARSLDPYGMRIAETPQEAGQVVQQSLQNAAASEKAAVQQAYKLAQGLPGEIHPSAFENMGSRIRSDLWHRDEPVVVDDQLTPFASRAVRDLDDRVSQLQIQNRASPFGQPAPEDIAGINLAGVDQMRRRLSAFRKNAFSSGNAADGRAAQAVLDAFDDQIDGAVNGGLFRGDPRAVQAWNDARAANADYRRTYTAQKNDPVGRVVEKVLGKGNNEAAIPNDVADYLYGSTGINPSSLHVGVAKRVRDILGDRSPEWSGVKQGLFSRLIEPAPGMTDWGPGKVANRVNQFLNGGGKEMSETVFSVPELDMLKQYAELQRALEVPQVVGGAADASVGQIVRRIGGMAAHLVGGAIGHMIAPGFYGVGETVGAGIVGRGTAMAQEAARARKIARQMPLVTDAMRKWQKAVAVAQRKNLPVNQRLALVAQAELAHALQQLGVRPSIAGFAEAPSGQPTQAGTPFQRQSANP